MKILTFPFTPFIPIWVIQWDPIYGCKNDCWYCCFRLPGSSFKNFSSPSFSPSKLEIMRHRHAPRRVRNGAHEVQQWEKNVKACWGGDAFGPWVPDEHIEAVLDVVRARPDWNFMFLTKFPSRLPTFRWPENVWLGGDR